MKKSIGSQYSFANLDGARASIDSVDRLSISERQEEVEADEEVGTVSSPAASPEPRVNDHTVIWTVDGRCILVPVTEVTEYPGATRWPKEWEDEEEKEKEEKEEENVTTDSTSMLESSRNPTVPCTSEVATEPTNAEFDPDLEVTEFDQVKTHPRPLQRARSRYKERTGNSPWENRHSSDCSPHVPAVESGKHPGEACLESDEVPAWEDDPVKFYRQFIV